MIIFVIFYLYNFCFNVWNIVFLIVLWNVKGSELSLIFNLYVML